MYSEDHNDELQPRDRILFQGNSRVLSLTKRRENIYILREFIINNDKQLWQEICINLENNNEIDLIHSLFHHERGLSFRHAVILNQENNIFMITFYKSLQSTCDIKLFLIMRIDKELLSVTNKIEQLSKILKSENIDFNLMQLLCMLEYKNKCHMLFSLDLDNDSKQSVIGIHIIYDIEEDEFKLLSKINDLKPCNDYRLFNIESKYLINVRPSNFCNFMKCQDNKTHHIAINHFNEITNKWNKHFIRSNILLKLPKLRCCISNTSNDLIFIENNGSIFMIQNDSKEFIRVKIKLTSQSEDPFWTNQTFKSLFGSYKAIKIGDKYKDELVVAYYIRLLSNNNNLTFPPNYIINLMASFFSNEQIYIIREHKRNKKCHVWRINMDTIYKNISHIKT